MLRSISMATEKRKHGAVHDDPDQRYFQTHLSRLVRERGGEWIVLAEGNLVGIREQTTCARAHPEGALQISPRDPVCRSHTNQKKTSSALS